MRLDELLRDGQSQAGPAVAAVERAVRLIKLLENERDLVGGDAGAGVGNADIHLPRICPGRQLDVADLGEAVGVVDQVQDHLPDARLVDPDDGQVIGQIHAELDLPSTEQVFGDVQPLVEDGRDRGRLAVELEAGHLEA